MNWAFKGSWSKERLSQQLPGWAGAASGLRPGLRAAQLCRWPAVWPWTSRFTSLSRTWLISRVASTLALAAES